MSFISFVSMVLAIIMNGSGVVPARAELISPPPATVDQFAPYVKATTTVLWRGADTKIEFIADGDYAMLRATTPAFAVPQFMPVRSPHDALLVLAEKRLAPLWPALNDWAGSDLVKLRDRQLALALFAYQQGGSTTRAQNTAESTVGSKTAAFLQYLGVLASVGQEDKAKTLLDTEIAHRYSTDEKMNLDTSMLVLRKANLIAFDGNAAGAASYLQNIIKTARIDSKWMTNINVNLAAFLAESGQFKAALDLIQTTRQTFLDQTYDGTIPGSDRQFAWIQACALNGLGRKADAIALMNIVDVAPETITDRDFVISPTPEIIGRASVCMNDNKKIIDLNLKYYADDYLVSGTHLAVQADFDRLKRNREFYRSVYTDPQLRAELTGRMRELPAELKPAVNKWR